jgi:hypothetical protein
MLIVKDRFVLFDDLQVWWPSSAEDVVSLLSQSPVVTVNQCSDQVARALEPYAFRSRPFHTLLIDLTLPEPALWARLNAKSCRQPIKRVRELGCSVSVNEDGEQAFAFINRFIQRRSYRRPMSAGAWRRNLEHGDVFIAKHEDRILAAHLVLVDRPHRARLLAGATARLEGGVQRTLMGGVDRYLHWWEFNHYRAEGIRSYDLGGLVLDQRSPLYSISSFKLSFGGEIVRQNIMRLAAHGGLRVALRGLAQAKGVGERLKRLADELAQQARLVRIRPSEAQTGSVPSAPPH